MLKKKKKNQFKRPPTDVMTHGALWLILSVAFFILNYYGQTVQGYTLADPQIYQFILAPIIWAMGLGLHAYAHRQLNQSFIPLNAVRSMRHKLRDIHIGVFVAFFMMLFSMGLTASIAGTGDLNVLSTLGLLFPWAGIVGVHSWIVHIIDQRNSSSQEKLETENEADISRLIDEIDHNDVDELSSTDSLKKTDYQTT